MMFKKFFGPQHTLISQQLSAVSIILQVPRLGIPDSGVDALAKDIFDFYHAIFSKDNHSTLHAATVRDNVLFLDVLIDTNRHQQLQLLNPTKMQALQNELASAMLGYFASRYAVERVSVRVKSAELPQDVLELRFGFNVHHSTYSAPLFALHLEQTLGVSAEPVLTAMPDQRGIAIDRFVLADIGQAEAAEAIGDSIITIAVQRNLPVVSVPPGWQFKEYGQSLQFTYPGGGTFSLLLKVFSQAVVSTNAPVKEQQAQNSTDSPTGAASTIAATFAPAVDEVGFSLHASKNEMPQADINLLHYETADSAISRDAASAALDWDNLPPVPTEDFEHATPVPTLDFDTDEPAPETKASLGLNLVAIVADGAYLNRLHIKSTLPPQGSQKVDATDTFHQVGITALHTLNKPVTFANGQRIELGRNSIPAIFPMAQGINDQGKQIDLLPYAFSREHAVIELTEATESQPAARITPIADTKKKPLFVLQQDNASTLLAAELINGKAYLIAGVFVFELTL